jgi:predicted alpha/beta superfamily hydrolase
MHDGQNLFIPEKSYTHITWGVAEAITKLSGWGFIRPAMVVGIDNTENRFGDYLPTRPFETPEGQTLIAAQPEEVRDEIERTDFAADAYLDWIVTEVKPQMDKDFRTLPERDNTFVMGSSMGGLISLYALLSYPDVFGGTGCLSTAWPVLDALLMPYLERFLPEAGRHKFYFDLGSEELDEAYAPYQKAVDALMRRRGYVFGEDWLTRFAAGAGHNEKAWRSRLHVALRFFLGG